MGKIDRKPHGHGHKYQLSATKSTSFSTHPFQNIPEKLVNHSGYKICICILHCTSWQGCSLLLDTAGVSVVFKSSQVLHGDIIRKQKSSHILIVDVVHAKLTKCKSFKHCVNWIWCVVVGSILFLFYFCIIHFMQTLVYFYTCTGCWLMLLCYVTRMLNI